MNSQLTVNLQQSHEQVFTAHVIDIWTAIVRQVSFKMLMDINRTAAHSLYLMCEISEYPWIDDLPIMGYVGWYHSWYKILSMLGQFFFFLIHFHNSFQAFRNRNILKVGTWSGGRLKCAQSIVKPFYRWWQVGRSEIEKKGKVGMWSGLYSCCSPTIWSQSFFNIHKWLSHQV